MDIPQLTFLRFLAAAGVVIFHRGRDAPLLEWGEPLWAISNTGVAFFFFLSGFILTHVYGQKEHWSRKEFYLARFARVMPLYLLALGASAAYAAYKSTLEWEDLFLSLLMIQAWIPGHALVLNAPGWSLSVEAFFYLWFPFLLPLLSRIRSLPALIAGFLLCWAASLALHVVLADASAVRPDATEFANAVFYHPLGHVGTFVVGVLGGLIHLRHGKMFQARASTWMLMSCLVFTLFAWTDGPWRHYHHNGLLAPLIFLFVVSLAQSPANPVARVFSLKPLVTLGEISYGIYILQGPVAILAVKLNTLPALRLDVEGDAWFFSYFALLVAVSYLAYRFVEVPLRRAIRAKGRRAP